MSSPNSLDFYDAELRAHHEHLRAAYGISPGDEVVDIGRGTGLTTREAARTVERLRETLAAHYSDERGVALDSRSWLITARRRR